MFLDLFVNHSVELLLQKMTHMVTSLCYYSFVGRLFVKALGKPSEILTKLNEMAGFSPNEEIELYEVPHNSVFISLEYTLQYACSAYVLLVLIQSVQVLDCSSVSCAMVNFNFSMMLCT